MVIDLPEPYASALGATYGRWFDDEKFALLHYSAQPDGDLCLIAFGAPDLRIKFEFEHGIPSCFVGTPHAEPIWGGEWNGEEVWFAAPSLLDFLEGRGSNPPVETGPQQVSIPPLEELMREPAAHLHDQLPAVRMVFSQARDSDFWTRYQTHRADKIERIRRRFGL